MTSLNLATPRRALAIGAHPDDIEFGCGGTLSKWAARGCAISLLVCTDGAKGSWDPDREPAELVVEREAEQREAARRLGATGSLVFLGYPDGGLVESREIREELAGWIRRLRPEVVISHDPWRRYRLHPDHRHAGFLVTDALVDAREPHVDLEGLPPHRASTLLLFEAEVVDHLEEISTFLAAKIEALTAHRSQLVSTMRVAPEELDDLAVSESYRRFIARLRDECAAFGAPRAIPLAEGFKRIEDL